MSLIDYVKKSRALYGLYYFVGGMFVKFLGHLVCCDSKLIVFVSYGGRSFDDSPRCIYESMLSDSRFNGYRFVWAFASPDSISIPRGEKVKIDSFRYFWTILKARVWVTNVSMTRGLSFKGRRTFYLNTWHGTPIKCMGDERKDSVVIKERENLEQVDIMLARSRFEIDLFSKIFGLEEDKILMIGYPRNDELTSVDRDKVHSIRQKFGIDEDKIVILYAPTYREYRKGNPQKHRSLPINIHRWQAALGEGYVLLLRTHPVVSDTLDITESSFVHNVSSYPRLNDLLLISDILISDYSSIFFDYSILGRPMLCYWYDYEEYIKSRGLYLDIEESLQCRHIRTEDDLLQEVSSLDVSARQAIAADFSKKYVQVYGNSSILSCDLIYKEVSN